MRKGLSYSDAGKLGATQAKTTQQSQKQERIDQYLLNPTLCKYCNSILPYEKRKYKFCNHHCAASITNIGVAHNGQKIQKYCKQCNTKLTNNKSIYCSRKCFNQSTWEKTKEKIIHGKTNDNNRNILRKFLFEQYGNICSICEFSEWRGLPIHLIMDHIDGDSSNNLPDNLRLICPNCDAQLPTYKGKNKGKGRINRMNRYYNGQSY